MLNKVADALADRSLYCHRVVQPRQHATGATDVVVSDDRRKPQVGKPQFVGLACSCASICLKTTVLSGAGCHAARK
jgi:hypothetical protein